MAPKYWRQIGFDPHGNRVFLPVANAEATRVRFDDESLWSMYHGCIVYMGTFVVFYGQVFFEYYKYTYIYMHLFIEHKGVIKGMGPKRDFCRVRPK